jgi:hypothetical protein
MSPDPGMITNEMPKFKVIWRMEVMKKNKTMSCRKHQKKKLELMKTIYPLFKQNCLFRQAVQPICPHS